MGGLFLFVCLLTRFSSCELPCASSKMSSKSPELLFTLLNFDRLKAEVRKEAFLKQIANNCVERLGKKWRG